MKVAFHGVRGTSTVTGSAFSGFGGDTTTVLVSGQHGERICLDAGTGILGVGQDLKATADPRSLLLLFTHYHLDHIAGLGSLAQLYDELWHIEMAAPRRDGISVRDAVGTILNRPYWPVPLQKMPARIELTDLPEPPSEPHDHGSLVLRWCPVHHDNGCTAYRIDDLVTGGSLVFATDLEWGASTAVEQDTFLQLCTQPAPVSMLVFDGQYTRDSYGAHAGWGHSTVEEAAAIARTTGAGRLLVTHHAPDQTDPVLLELEARLAGLLAGGGLARQGMTIDL